MATNQGSRSIDNEAREELDAIDESLRTQLEQDARLTSGVPEAHRGGDLEFIQMSGLTRPVIPEHRPLQRDYPSDLDPSQPLNFFEAGVADVDATMDPGTLDSVLADSEDVAKDVAPTESAKGLREILAQLASEEAAPLLDDFEHAATDRSVEDRLDPQALLDAGGADVLKREIESEQPRAPAPQPESSPPERDGGPYGEPVVEAEEVASGGPAPSSEPDPLEALLSNGPERDDGRVGSDIDESALEDIAVAYDFLHTPSIDDALQQSLAEDAESSEPLDQSSRTAAEAGASGGNREQPAAGYPAHPAGTGPTSLQVTIEPPVVTRAAPATIAGWEETSLPRPRVDLDEASPSWLTPQEGPLLQRREQRRRSHNGRRGVRRRVRRWIVRAVIVLVFAGALAAAAWTYRDVYQPPINLYMQADSLAADGAYIEASHRYQQFADRHPDDPLRPTAQFHAAQVLSHVRPQSQDERTELYRRALSLYTAFIEENPGHPRVARAARLSAQLQYELGQYDDVIRDYQPGLQIQDPTSGLPALRLVARSYDQLGEFEHAESAYLRAASMESNLSPEHDYESLADLRHRQGERSEEPVEREEHFQKSLSYLELALESPSIEPESYDRIRAKRDTWHAEMSGSVEVTPEITITDSNATAPEEAATAAVSTADLETTDEDAAHRELDPTAEAEHLEQVMTTPSVSTDSPPAAGPGAAAAE